MTYQVIVLEDNEQYRMQMAGISCASMGGWKEGDEIHPDYATNSLNDVAALYKKYDAKYKLVDQLVAVVDALAETDESVGLTRIEHAKLRLSAIAALDAYEAQLPV